MFAENVGDSARARLQMLEATTNGFEIAAADLQARGPGEVLGTQQHGLPSYQFANLATDLDLLQTAQEDARAVLRGHIRLSGTKHGLLARRQRSKDKRDTHLIHVA